MSSSFFGKYHLLSSNKPKGKLILGSFEFFKFFFTRAGLEPMTSGLMYPRSTNWAITALHSLLV